MKSIRRQLTRDLFLTLTAVAVVVVAAMYLVFWEMLLEDFDARLRAQALAVQSLTEFEDGKVQYDFSEDFLASYNAERPRNYFQLRDGNGVEISRSPSLHDGQLPDRAGKNIRAARYTNLRLPSGRAGRSITYSFVPETTGTTGHGPAPWLVVSVAVDREELNETLFGLVLAGLAGLGVLIGAIFVVVPRVLRRGLQPMVSLAERAAAIDADSLGTRFETANIPAEVQPVSARLNDLLARLENSFERERRFSADLAHELRTPLAELRSMSECALKWPDQRDPAFEAEILLVTQHMEALVVHLLALTRGEESSTLLADESMDVSSLVATVWALFAVKAEARKIRVNLAVAEGIVATGDSPLLRAILINLFDNAVSYTPSDGTIFISAQLLAGEARIEVTNGPVDLDASEVEKIFDRFWRKEAARSDRSHFGLGLSLCRNFARSIGWTVAAELAGRNLSLILTAKKKD